MVLSLEQGGNANIYRLDLRTRQLTRLTDSPSIDTAPCYSPDGSQIAFESDRGGQQQIYVMSANGGPAQRISFGSGRYGTPVWSPRGDLIAFTKQEDGRVQDRRDAAGRVGRAHPDRRIPQRRPDLGAERPRADVLPRYRAAPTGGPQLWSIDITGYNEQIVPTPSFASDPAWSPLLS